MKKSELTIVATLLCLIFFASVLIEPQSVKAQSVHSESFSYSLIILSPSNITYNSNSLLLNVAIHRQFNPTEYNSRIMYSLNGEANVSVPSTSTFFDLTTPGSIFSALASYTLISGTTTLQNLSECHHFLTVFGIYERAEGISTKYPAIMYDFRTVYFTINKGIAPNLTNLQIENKTYSQNDLPLNITVDKRVSWMGYSLDGQANITFTQNITLNELAYGSHSLIVYANDILGNMGASENVNFFIEKNEFFPFLPFAIILITAIISNCAGLLAYYKRKNKL